MVLPPPPCSLDMAPIVNIGRLGNRFHAKKKKAVQLFSKVNLPYLVGSERNTISTIKSIKWPTLARMGMRKLWFTGSFSRSQTFLTTPSHSSATSNSCLKIHNSERIESSDLTPKC